MPFPPLICRWPNGDISLVAANSRTEADFLLDEISNPDRAQLLPLSHPIAIHFSLERISPGDAIVDAVCLDDPGFNEELMQSMFERVYPVLSQVLANPECTQQMIDDAIEQERAPIGEEHPEVSAHPDAARVQAMMELPKSLAEALTEMAEDAEEGDEGPDEEEDLDQLYEELQAEPNPYFQMRTACKLISVASAQNRITHLGQTFASPSEELPAIVTSFATCPVSRAADLSALLERTIQNFFKDNDLAQE
jgi:hypothetical protein